MWTSATTVTGMQGGDIGDEGHIHIMRIALVWEGVCAEPPVDHPKAKERWARLRGRDEDWERVVRSWTIHEKPLQRIYALHLKGVPVDIFTFVGPEFADALRDHLERLYVEVGRVEYYESADHVARMLRISPDVQYVIDSDPARLELYGRHKAKAAKMGDDWGQFI